MANITLRSIKGSPLTIEETDANFSNLNTEVGTKLDATSYNAADILVKLKTVDTDTSGLNANFLQGLLPLSTNTVGSIVSRDSSGNFAAGTITANLTGNTSGVHTGNVTGNVTGDLTGTASNATSLGGNNFSLYLLAATAASTYATITSDNLKAPIASPTFTGVPAGPTAAPGTSTTQLATTAFVQNVASSLGTLSSQNANNVTITGGSISLTSALGVASGGTGAATLTANSVLLGNGTSALQSVAPGAAGNVLTSDGTTWASSALGVIGVGQTWTDVKTTPGRVAGTTYTNSTGKPIFITVSAGNGSAQGISFTINGSVVANCTTVNGYSNTQTVSFVIPNGSTYSLSSGATIANWFELR